MFGRHWHYLFIHVSWKVTMKIEWKNMGVVVSLDKNFLRPHPHYTRAAFSLWKCFKCSPFNILCQSILTMQQSAVILDLCLRKPWAGKSHHLAAYYTIIMSRTLKVTDKHVMYAWLRCMISKDNQVKFACFLLLAISEEAKTWLPFLFFIQCIIKQ